MCDRAVALGWILSSVKSSLPRTVGGAHLPGVLVPRQLLGPTRPFPPPSLSGPGQPESFVTRTCLVILRTEHSLASTRSASCPSHTALKLSWTHTQPFYHTPPLPCQPPGPREPTVQLFTFKRQSINGERLHTRQTKGACGVWVHSSWGLIHKPCRLSDLPLSLPPPPDPVPTPAMLVKAQPGTPPPPPPLKGFEVFRWLPGNK